MFALLLFIFTDKGGSNEENARSGRTGIDGSFCGKILPGSPCCVGCSR